MNRMDRLFAITTLLQARSRLRAQNLAREFEVTAALRQNCSRHRWCAR